MTDFLDDLPLDFANPLLRELVDVLVANVEDQDEIRDIAKRAGMATGRVSFKREPYLLWPAVLVQARAQDKQHDLITQVKSGRSALAKRIGELFSAQPSVPATAQPASLGEWQGGAERLLASRSTLLDIDFLAKGMAAAKSVCLLTARNGNGDTWYGSGFVVAPGVVLSNHHVLFAKDAAGPAAWVEARFFYENGGTSVEIAGDAASIAGDRDLDWAAIRLRGEAPSGCGPLPLGSSRPPGRGEPAFIVQHPGGGPKKIGLYRNEIRHVDDRVVQYLTDTQTGSSGSPVCNDRWEVIALHHSCIKATDGSSEIRNQGVRIERVVEGLRARGLLPEAT